jgi:hypothetical protein
MMFSCTVAKFKVMLIWGKHIHLCDVPYFVVGHCKFTKSGTWNPYHSVTVYEELLELTVERIGLPNSMENLQCCATKQSRSRDCLGLLYIPSSVARPPVFQWPSQPFCSIISCKVVTLTSNSAVDFCLACHLLCVWCHQFTCTMIWYQIMLV